jgi:hypothetical protein
MLMFTRREWIGAGFGVAGAGGAEQPAGTDARRLDEMITQFEAMVAELRQLNSGCSTGTCGTVGRVRDAMSVFLRANAKFPDALEVGPGIFYDVYDWHIRNRLPVSSARAADGRYALGFMFTRLLLRPDAQPDYLGAPYDLRA